MTDSFAQTKPPNRLAEDGGFKDKTILITGATGFLGKVLVEKMLRTCPLVKRIYVIIRTKKGKDPQTRLEEIVANPLFNLLKKVRGEEILKKVIPISGDIVKLELGLSQENRKMLITEVEIIFHMAATVRFDEPLKRAVLLNTRGTKLLLELAKGCKKLLVFAHVSTAFCHPHEETLYEKMYPPPSDPHNTIKIAEILDEKVINVITDTIVGNYPNTYTYTKALAEGLVNEEMDNIPVIILRPSAVVPIWNDPLPGWTDNINGPVGLLIAIGKGGLGSVLCNPNFYSNLIPVDIAANAVMVATYNYITFRNQRVFNVTTSPTIKVTFGDMVGTTIRIFRTTTPLNWAIWYPGSVLQTSRLYHNTLMMLYHYIPAYIVDSLMVLSGKKPILLKYLQKIAKAVELMEYFTTNQWHYDHNNLLNSIKQLNETEKKIYKTDKRGFDLEKYTRTAVHSVRLYLLKENNETLATAIRHVKILWIIDRFCKIVMLPGFGYLLLKYIRKNKPFILTKYSRYH